MKNVGTLDRAIRILIGLALHSWWGLVGLVPLLTAAIGWCPAYLPFGLSTCPAKRR